VRHNFASGPLRVGRAPGNELRLLDPRVSAWHCVIAPGPSGVHVTDLGSTHGVLLNGHPAGRSAALSDGDVLTLGDASLVVELRAGAVPTMVLEDRTAGVAVQPGETLLLSEGPVEVIETDDGVRLDGVGHAVELAVGETVTIAGHELTLRLGASASRTAGAERWPYVVHTSVDTRVRARFEDPTRAVVHAVRSENRACLIYLLAKAASNGGGWCDDHTLRVGIWGHAHRGQLDNNLNVVIRRTRLELDRSGFEGMCIQKIHGHTRLAVERVELPDGK